MPCSYKLDFFLLHLSENQKQIDLLKNFCEQAVQYIFKNSTTSLQALALQFREQMHIPFDLYCLNMHHVEQNHWQDDTDHQNHKDNVYPGEG